MGSNGGSLTQAIGLLLLRVGAAGFLFYGHGWGKITHFTERAAKFSDPLHVGSATSLGLVVFAEVFCAIFVALGLFTRVAVLPILFMLGVAAFVHHAADPFPRKELALIYFVAFLALLFTGPGRFALDAIMGPRKGGKG